MSTVKDEYRKEILKFAFRKLKSKKMPMTRKRVLAKRLAFAIEVKHLKDGIPARGAVVDAANAILQFAKSLTDAAVAMELFAQGHGELAAKQPLLQQPVRRV